MSLDTILKRLPSHYDKNPSSNNYKALSLVAKHIDDSEELYATIQKFWDVDQAVGKGLDRLGKDEGISRGSYDDDTYRKLIKIEFIVNMSEGDGEVMNTILEAYMGDDFLYTEEGWNSFLKEPASLILNISKDAESIPFQLVKRIKPAGVRVYYSAEVDRFTVIVTPKEYTFPIPYPITGTFTTTSIHGVASKATPTIEAKEYTFQVPYPITGTFYCEED
ncbi:DUF2612 domain-containing protein [Sporosarcina sp. FSL K6-1508]|uniref:DUF2612 domain-containing protein n=1 Tax=Sporosarcina sp. FSL K6-1508 TaxID=2921553 RepID=UPI0030FB15AF